ncbi:PEP-CTERM motif protein [Symmachiella macrocystis]|uniref:PEP-CTERM motif protein n=1 Tax=Symmachiella macrocystis TaxID=2527985 RepID=A0A5C6BCX3_9PLAN|nr:PEP-CTERM sorting domain-containing protein [Symmachiella macrocystis]TWU09562.1 PEP-CTERM motif protein [Symmachiella macrocystis]
MKLRSVGFSGLILFMAVLGPTVAQAGLVSYTADVSDGPGYNRPMNGNPPTSQSGFATNNFFDAQPFYVDLTGQYRMEVVAHLSGSRDSYLILYENSFDPANPLGNALEADDDGAGFPFSRIDRILTAGTNYILVTSTFSNNVLASYTNEIEGQGNINFGSTSAVPEPSSVVLLGIGGIALAGCGWRRKRRAAA